MPKTTARSTAPTTGGQAPPSAGAGKTHTLRRDIQGLRALAVLSVAFNHMTQRPSGGFVGVDVFFVISGYLITGLLLREATATGRISFRDFYLRRAKRILPGAALVLSVTVAAAWVIYFAGEAKTITVDAVWAAFFVGNWRFADLGTNYMNSATTPSPIQHFWSLGVEEQFYIVWPWLLLAALLVARKIKADRKRTTAVLAVAMLLPLVGSFIFAEWQTKAETTVAYFSTFSRGWELGIGALLAVTTANFGGFRLVARQALYWAGLIAIAISLFLITSHTTFPAPWAAVPVLGSAAVILGGVGTKQQRAYDRGAWLLTNPLSNYVGKISYSFYLWHFPVIILLGSFLHPGSTRYYAVALVLMSVLSIASFHLVEDPIRRSSLGKARRRQTEAAALWGRGSKRREWAAVGSLAAVVVALPMGAYALAGQVSALNAPLKAAPPSNAWATQTARTRALQAALDAKAWPQLFPNPLKLGSSGDSAKATEWINDGCLGGQLSTVVLYKDPVQNAKHCVYGSATATHTMVVFGDSTTMSYVPGIMAAVAGQDWRVYVYTVAACTPTLVPNRADDGATPECIEFKNWVEQQIEQMKPTMVVSSFSRNDGQLKDGATGTAADAEWTAQIQAMGKLVLQYSQSYVLLAAPMLNTTEPGVCITRFSHPSDCVEQATPLYNHQLNVQADAMTPLGPHAKFVDTEPWFCVDNRCPAFIGNTLTFADELHLTNASSVELGPLMRQALFGD